MSAVESEGGMGPPLVVAGVGPSVEGGGEAGVVLANELDVGSTGTVGSSGVVTASVTSSSGPWKVSPRAAEHKNLQFSSRRQLDGHDVQRMVFCHCTDSFWGTQSQSPHSSFHSTHTWSRTDIYSVI